MEGRELPVGWVVAPLLGLGELIRGVTYSKNDASDKSFFGSIPVLRANNIQDRHFDTANLVHVPTSLVAQAQIVKAGDVVIATSSGSISVVGKAAQAREDLAMAFGAFCGLIRPSNEILPEYFGHFFSSAYYRTAVSDMARGVNINNLKKSHFETLKIPLAPLNEQRRIAAKLDTTLAAVEACRQRLDGVAAILKRFRQAVLAAATSGELTREWREEMRLEAAPTISLGEIIKVSSGRFLPAKAMVTCGGIPVYGGNGVNGLHNESNVSQPTLVIGRVGYYCGSIYLTPEKAWVTDNALVVKHDAATTRIKYLYYALQGIDLRVNDSSTAQPVISAAKIYPLEVICPCIEEQDELIDRIESLFSLADQLEARLNAARKIVDRLTPALLAKAFRGELMPQDPGDEPARVLLERIRAARQAEAGAGKTSRRGRPKAAANPEPINRNAATAPSEPLPPDLLTQLLRECGALSERALLAVSELEPERFEQQLFRELEKGTAREVQANGQVLLEAVG